jgi:hypothetical protein
VSNSVHESRGARGGRYPAECDERRTARIERQSQQGGTGSQRAPSELTADTSELRCDVPAAERSISRREFLTPLNLG